MVSGKRKLVPRRHSTAEAENVGSELGNFPGSPVSSPPRLVHDIKGA